MPRPYPREFREDVIRVARSREPGVRLQRHRGGIRDLRVVSEQLAEPSGSSTKDFGRVRPPTSSSRTASCGNGCGSSRRRTRCCAERRRICRRRTCRENDLPPRPRARRRRGSRHGDVSGPEDRPSALLPVAPLRSEREWNEAHLANALFDAHRDDPEFGYRFLADEVHAAGFQVCERRVWRRCSENGWWSMFGRRTSRKRSKPRHARPC